MAEEHTAAASPAWFPGATEVTNALRSPSAGAPADGSAVCLGAEAAQRSGDLSRGAGPAGGVAFAGGAQA